MNVLVVGKFYVEGFALHIAETLDDMGHRVTRFEPGLQLRSSRNRIEWRMHQVVRVIHESTDALPAIRARRMQVLWSVAEAARPDVVLICHDFLWPREVEELKKRTGATIAMWFPDALSNFGRAYFMNAPYDALFFKDPYIPYALGDVLKPPIYYLPECMNPVRHGGAAAAAGDVGGYACDITAAGNQHSWRVAFYKHLRDYDVKLWGNPAPLWMPAGAVAAMHQGRPVHNDDKVKAFRSARIVVNNLHYAEIWGVSVRVFEAAGAGAFQLVDWRPAIHQLFDEGTELVTFRGIYDCIRKVKYWLPRDEERRAIASAGMARAYREHTYAIRLQLLLDTLAGRERGHAVPNIEWGREREHEPTFS
jgi:spore maturation protein CgeB